MRLCPATAIVWAVLTLLKAEAAAAPVESQCSKAAEGIRSEPLVLACAKRSWSDPSFRIDGKSFATTMQSADLIDTGASGELGAAFVKHVAHLGRSTRVAGTSGAASSRDYIVGALRDHGWDVSLDRFSQSTPVGEREFVNIVAVHPKYNYFPYERRDTVVLAAHYDSKLFPENMRFIGATDSVASCAMILALAGEMCEHAETMPLKLVFFDGEEAFVEWTATDSLYGSRHLAASWEESGELARIGSLVLLDLLGAPRPQIHLYSEQGARCYSLLHQLEKLSGAFPGRFSPPSRPQYSLQIEDDHTPFLRRGVPTVHVIPFPFPSVWHTPKDDLKVLHGPTCEHFLRLFAAFLRVLRGECAQAGGLSLEEHDEL